jgi:hypothetical protein
MVAQVRVITRGTLATLVINIAWLVRKLMVSLVARVTVVAELTPATIVTCVIR